MIIRSAQASDTLAIAKLHAESWRDTYRGILRDEYLDGPVGDDRLQLWTARFSNPAEPWLVMLAEEGREIRAFICAFLDADPEWGAMVDNLHVSPASQGQGLGRRLMSEAAAWVLRRRPRSRLHLWVYEQNLQARRFYERIGGVLAGQEPYLAPDGEMKEVVRYGWTELTGLSGTPPASD